MPEPYSSCPCGSGEKFKRCCEKIYPAIQRAYEQAELGQNEAALRILRDLTQKHPDNPEAWGQLARMLYANEKLDEAEESLEKAFAINPNYPYGLLLRGMFRYHEGEHVGALTLMRKAVAAYAPDARDFLVDAYSVIFDCEMSRGNYLAARFALGQSVRMRPDHDELQQTLEHLYGPQGEQPPCVRREYAFREPTRDVRPELRPAWDQVLHKEDAPKLSDLVAPLEQLTREEPTDPAGWFNLGLLQAWQGNPRPAKESFERSLELETDDDHATTTATLIQVLLMGEGFEEESEYANYAFDCQIRDPGPIQALLGEWLQTRQLILLSAGNQGREPITGLLLETGQGLVTAGTPAADALPVVGNFYIISQHIIITTFEEDVAKRYQDEVRRRLGLGVNEAGITRKRGSFSTVTARALLMPTSQSAEITMGRLQEHMRKYFEEKWIHRPRRDLAGTTPLDAVGHPLLRKKLLGAIQFIEDCADTSGRKLPVDMDRVRRKLGLAAGPAVEDQPLESLDIPSLGAADLAKLPTDNLSLAQLEQAWQTAMKLDAGELALHFVRSLVARPQEQSKPDRYPWYNYLVQRAVMDGNLDDALDQVNEGERLDCEINEGLRRNEYELRRGQVHTRRGEGEEASNVFGRLLERSPDNLKFHVQAVEAMLALKKHDVALRFAEKGVEEARKQQNRDAEGELLELAEAARRG